MRIVNVLGAIFTILLVLTGVWIIYQVPLEPLTAITDRTPLLNFTSVTKTTASYLWNERISDTLVQVLVIFSAVICALGLFAGGKRKWTQE